MNNIIDKKKSANAESNLVFLENVSKKYNTINVLNNLSLEIKAKESISLLGASGCGKSTLLNLIAMFDNCSSGNIFIDKKNIAKMKESEKNLLRQDFIGFIHQFHNLFAEFSVIENIKIPMFIARDINNRYTNNEIDERAKLALENVGIYKYKNSMTSTLSGGEKQRVSIARALANTPKLILADEPTGSLDEYNSKMIFELLEKQRENYKSALLMVTHDNELAKLTEKSYYLSEGEIKNNR